MDCLCVLVNLFIRAFLLLYCLPLIDVSAVAVDISLRNLYSSVGPSFTDNIHKPGYTMFLRSCVSLATAIFSSKTSYSLLNSMSEQKHPYRLILTLLQSESYEVRSDLLLFLEDNIGKLDVETQFFKQLFDQLISCLDVKAKSFSQVLTGYFSGKLTCIAPFTPTHLSFITNSRQ